MGWWDAITAGANGVTIVLGACGVTIASVSAVYLYVRTKLLKPFQESIQHLRLIPAIEEKLAATDVWGLILASSLKIGRFQTNAAGRTISVNSAICRLTHRAESEFLGYEWVNVIHPADRAAITAGWGSAVRQKRSFEASYRWMRSDGTPVRVCVHAAPHIGSDGRLLGFQAVVRPCEADDEFN